jgi:HEPN domain-containing protein
MKIDMPKEWLRASLYDLKTISKIIAMEDLSHIVAFHAQQSIEKSLKALIEYKNIKVPKQHDLLRLEKLVQDNLTIKNDDLLDSLNELYIESRYPGDMGLLPYGKPTLTYAQEFFDYAQNLFYEVCDILKIKADKL